MCHWGMSYVLGPNINLPMSESANEPAWEALQKAVVLSGEVSDKERRYIQALSRRYEPTYKGDRTQLDEAYAAAMRSLVQDYPDDLNAKTLFAEASMDTMPWDYWNKDGSPKLKTVELIDTLNTAIARDPDNPGALHLLIHAVEAQQPELAVEAADRFERSQYQCRSSDSHAEPYIFAVTAVENAIAANEKAVEADT